MSIKKEILYKMLDRDILEEQIQNLQKKKNLVNLEINALKNKMEREHKHWIGRKAICSHYTDTNLQNKELVCSDVFCTELLEVVPRFELDGEQVHIDEYYWIDEKE